LIIALLPALSFSNSQVFAWSAGPYFSPWWEK